MSTYRFVFVFSVFFGAPVVFADGTNPTFEKDVRPIFKANCFHCHGEEAEPKGHLDLRLLRLMTVGGESGPAIVPGKPSESLLWNRIESDEMPEGPKKLTAAQKSTIRAWIEQGATTVRAEPLDVAQAKYSEEELQHWAWQPVRTPVVPQINSDVWNPIDAFVLAKLKEQMIDTLSPEADKRTLIRRLTFDLHGLPPTPEEVTDFLNDQSAEAYDRVVARLLESPRYGERWARHWLDVAGYAETDGNMAGLDHSRPYAWKYRDYVIQSFNSDKPYDRFLREQLAGDEMVPESVDPTDLQTVALLTATGFLRMAPDVTESSDGINDRNQAVADAIKVVTSAAVGLTVGCAQCHDHRYDPISHSDYYRLRAIFDPAFDLHAWKKPSSRLFDATTPDVRKISDDIEVEAKAKEADILARKTELSRSILEKELAKVPDAERETIAATNAISEDDRTKEQSELLTKYPNVKSISFIVGFLEEYDGPAFRKFEEEKKAIEKLRETKPLPGMIMVPSEPVDHVPESHLFFRGDPEQPKDVVSPAELFVLTQHSPGRTIPADDPSRPSTGRRLRYAEILTDGHHPLTARVIVNRVWLHHFGKGLVNTPGDFGLNGDRPTHPELLDWLASQFMAEGWSFKKLHKSIVTSSAYRQRSIRTAELDQVDPDNRLLGRMNARRLEAEEVRDSLLAVSGVLNPEMYGPSVSVTEDTLGRGVIGKRELSSFGKPYGDLEKVQQGQECRRSIYIMAHRSMPLSMLETFDLPVMAPNCDLRKSSTVPPQSLMFLNDQTVLKHAENLTERLWKDAETAEGRIRRLFALLYSEDPTDDELAISKQFLATQAEYFRIHGDENWLETVKKWSHAPDMRAMEALCQTLLSANRFLYLD